MPVWGMDLLLAVPAATTAAKLKLSTRPRKAEKELVAAAEAQTAK